MTDRDAIVAMLDRAGIAYETENGTENDYVYLKRNTHGYELPVFVFHKDGSLASICTWN